MAGPGRVLLVNPWIHDFAAYDYWMRPLGLLYLAAVLHDAGWKTDFIDCTDRFIPESQGIRTRQFPRSKPDGRGKLLRTDLPKPDILRDIPRVFSRYGITPEMFREALTSGERPHAVLVTSMMTYWYTGVRESIQVVRDVFPDVPIMLGGVYATLLPEHAAAHCGADLVVRGEAENTIVSAAEELSGIPARTTTSYDTIDDYPLPRFSLLSDTTSLPLLTSRGCPYRCGYCASHRIIAGFRQRDPLKVVDEIEEHHDTYGTGHFAFYDDALLVNRERHFKVMMREVIGRDLGVSFHMPNAVHGREIDEEAAELMHDGDCRTVRIGLETSNEGRQLESGGKITSAEFLNAVRNLERSGYRRNSIEAYVMMGLPGQSSAEIEESMHFVHEAGCTVRMVSYTPIPGTALWQEALERNPSISEPLMQNNSLFPLRGTVRGWEQHSKLKEMAHQLNSAL